MRRFIVAASVAVALVVSAALPATAAQASVDSGWVPAPSAPFDRDAGVLCDFPIHAQPIVDEVRKRTLVSNPDGTPRSELYVGRLIVRVTNTSTGASFDADASGNAIIEYGADGSSIWFVLGPVLIGFREGSGNLPRGLWVINGVFRLAFDAAAHKTLTMLVGTQDNVCTHLA